MVGLFSIDMIAECHGYNNAVDVPIHTQSCKMRLLLSNVRNVRNVIIVTITQSLVMLT